MAQQELEARLRREGEGEALNIWRNAEAEAAQLRREAALKIDQQRQAAADRLQGENAEQHAAALSAGRKQAQSCRLQAEEALAERLKVTAQQLLEELAQAGGTPLFQALAAEIPVYAWQQVKVNPRDDVAARNAFPSATIVTDKEISAGLEVESSDKRIRIINSLEKRLIHIWPELLPDLFKEIRPMAGER